MTDKTTEYATAAPPHYSQQIAAPAAHPLPPASPFWMRLFLGAAGVVILGLLFAPGIPLYEKLQIVLQGVCAQQHNIFLSGLVFPICARCSGIYISFLLTLMFAWVNGRSRAGHIPPWSVLVALVAFVLFMGADGFNSFFRDLGLPYLYEPHNTLRVVTGMGMGVSIAVMVLLTFNLSLRADVDEQQPVLENWFELLYILLVNLLVTTAIFGNLDVMYWPLALLAFLGMSGVLYVVNLLACSLLLGYDGRVTHISQLAKPATLAIIPTIALLGGMSFLRFWLETQGLAI